MDGLIVIAVIWQDWQPKWDKDWQLDSNSWIASWKISFYLFEYWKKKSLTVLIIFLWWFLLFSFIIKLITICFRINSQISKEYIQTINVCTYHFSFFFSYNDLSNFALTAFLVFCLMQKIVEHNLPICIRKNILLLRIVYQAVHESTAHYLYKCMGEGYKYTWLLFFFTNFQPIFARNFCKLQFVAFKATQKMYAKLTRSRRCSWLMDCLLINSTITIKSMQKLTSEQKLLK